MCTFLISTHTGLFPNLLHGICIFILPMLPWIILNERSNISVICGLSFRFSRTMLPDHTPKCRFLSIPSTYGARNLFSSFSTNDSNIFLSRVEPLRASFFLPSLLLLPLPFTTRLENVLIYRQWEEYSPINSIMKRKHTGRKAIVASYSSLFTIICKL